MAAICARAARRILRLVDGDGGDGDDDDHGTAALLTDAARAPVGTLPIAWPPSPAKRLTADVDDFTLHADTAVAAHDRTGLERLARYGAARRSRTSACA